MEIIVTTIPPPSSDCNSQLQTTTDFEMHLRLVSDSESFGSCPARLQHALYTQADLAFNVRSQENVVKGATWRGKLYNPQKTNPSYWNKKHHTDITRKNYSIE